MSLFAEIAGWIGAALLILAYGLVSWGRMEGRSRGYQWLNIGGSALVLLNSLYCRALPSAATNLFWIMLGLSAMVATRRKNGLACDPAQDIGSSRRGQERIVASCAAAGTSATHPARGRA
jgi:hypothetical protein